MDGLNELTTGEISRGYYYNKPSNAYMCISCGKVFGKGEAYPMDGRYLHAKHAVKMHVEKEHKDRLGEMMNSNGKYLSLTDKQKELIRLFMEGVSDNEIAKTLNVSPSTVRHQKFVLREKAKSAKMYLAVWKMVTAEMEKRKDTSIRELMPVHGGAKMVDERYVITEEENKKILENVFESLEPLKLKVFSAKEKKKVVILRKIAEQFEKNKRYTEKEVNQLLKEIYEEDHVIIRRYLIEYGYMDRTKDCKEYWMR